MKMKIVTVYDRKTGVFGKPGFVRHLGDAIREFDVLRKAKDNKIGMNPEDHELVELGDYDDESGLFTSKHPFVTLSTGV